MQIYTEILVDKSWIQTSYFDKMSNGKFDIKLIPAEIGLALVSFL